MSLFCSHRLIRCCSQRHVHSEIRSVMSVVAAWIFSLRSSMVCGSVLDASDLQMMLEEKKSLGLRSGDLGGHSVVPQCPVHPVRLAPRQRDEVVLHRAESKPNIVLRVGLHPRTVATSHLTTGGTLWRTLPLIPAVLVPRECNHVERTTRFFWG
jgi:hypothetical protein